MYIFSVEGNIGSGKTTLVNRMKNTITHIRGRPVYYLPEPVDIWESIKDNEGQNMLQLFYSDPTKHAFAFQMMAYISRLSMMQLAIDEHPKCILITERCLLSDYNVFANMLYETNKISTEQMAIYKKWFYQFNVPISGLIYLHCEPENSYNRCSNRNRTGEETVSIDYLTQCHEKHEEWINLEEDIPIITIFNNDKTDIQDIVEFIESELSMNNSIDICYYLSIAALICVGIYINMVILIFM
jgi:deoxyadenosine/deoxycytidine kinase